LGILKGTLFVVVVVAAAAVNVIAYAE